MEPEKTYNTFAEADAAAAAEEEENAYGSSQDVTRKSAFKGGGGMSKPSDNFARVTWTDLAMGNKSAFGGDVKHSRMGSRAGSRSGKRQAGVGLTIDPDVAAFSLANQDQKIGQEFEEMKSETEQDEPEQIEDEDAPQQFKANFVRRNTIIRQQILESDDNLNFLNKSRSNNEIDQISDERNLKSGQGGRSDSDGNPMRSDQETDGILKYEDEEDQLLFGNFKFRSFKTHKLIEEDYELLNIEDPEDVTNISASTAFPEEKVGKEAVEIVPVTKDDLQQHKKQQDKTRSEQ